MRIKRPATVAAAAGLLVSLLAVAAFGAGGVGAVPAAKSRLASKTVLLTNSSDGSTVLATPGDLIVVELAGGQLRWSEAQSGGPPSTTPPVLERLSGSVSTDGSSTTTFRVVRYGLAEIDATGTPVCASVAAVSACPQYVVLWHATVTVPVVDPPAPVA